MCVCGISLSLSLYIYIYICPLSLNIYLYLSATVPLRHQWSVHKVFLSPEVGSLDLCRGPPPNSQNFCTPLRLRRDFFRAFFMSSFFLRFWAPISPKRGPKASIVQILEPKRLHFGSHFGALFGPAAKVKIELPWGREPS